MAQLSLTIVEGAEAGRTVSLADELVIGRHADAELTIDDDLASRRHARIRAEPDGVVIEDLGSTNGTLVNGEEIAGPTRLEPGDELLIGSCRMLVSLEAPESAPAETVAPPPTGPPAAPPFGGPPAAPPFGGPPAAPPLGGPPAAPPLTGPSAPTPRSGSAAPPLVGGAQPPPARDAGAPPEFTADAGSDPRIGLELAGYRIEAVIGRGGMGVVYRAEDLRLGRKVALKLLTPEMAGNEDFRVRFESESRLAAAIDHPSIIPLYDAGEAGGLLFLTMRFVDGLDLKAVIDREGPLPLERAIAIVAQVGGALDAAHARGLVHRDVKPANVLVASGAGPEASDHCYLTDFGLTKDTSAVVQLTAAGQFVGTIDYVAPEQIEGIASGGKADQYSLGCVFYECLTQRLPYRGQTELDVMWSHINEEPPRVTEHRPDLPPAIDAVLARALAKAPDDRYPDCASIASAARALLDRRGR